MKTHREGRARLVARVALCCAAGCAAPRLRIEVTPDEIAGPAPAAEPSAGNPAELERAFVGRLARGGADTAPVTSEIWIDGRLQARRTALLAAEYYGTIDLRAVAGGPAPQGSRHLAVRSRCAVPAPVSGWLFPLDFFAELAMAPFEPDPAWTHRIELPRAPAVVTGFVPPELPALRVRSRELATER